MKVHLIGFVVLSVAIILISLLNHHDMKACIDAGHTEETCIHTLER